LQSRLPALFQLPFRRFHEFCLLGNLLTKTGRGLARFQAHAHEERVGDDTGKARLLLVTAESFVDAALVVGRPAEVSSFFRDFFAARQSRVFVSHDVKDAHADDSDDQHHNDDRDDEQSFNPAWHSNLQQRYSD